MCPTSGRPPKVPLERKGGSLDLPKTEEIKYVFNNFFLSHHGRVKTPPFRRPPEGFPLFATASLFKQTLVILFPRNGKRREKFPFLGDQLLGVTELLAGIEEGKNGRAAARQ